MKRVAPATGALLLAGCSAAAPAPPPAGAPAGTVTVLAAASLSDAFQEIGRAFEARYPGVRVEFSFAGSAQLAGQVAQGAPADVFASADQDNMDRVLDHVDGQPRVFARNRLQIAVQPGNPKGIRGLADLARPGLAVVLCAPPVPCGRYSNQALQMAGVQVTPRSQEQDVKAVVAKVALGEADAGIVYVTDVRAAAGKVAGVDIPDSQNVVAGYPLAVLKEGPNPRGGRAFADFVLGPEAGRMLAGRGFAVP